MAKKSRKSGLRLTQRVWAPIGHTVNATGETIKEVVGTTGNIVKRGLNGVRRIGNSWTRHANIAVKKVVSRKGRRATRRSRK